MTDQLPAAGLVLAISTAPDLATASKIAQALLSARVAACVNVLPQGQSWYWWQGQIESAHEYVLLIKTRRERSAQLQAVLRAVHPYQVPELIVLGIEDGWPPYLQWVEQQTAPALMSPDGEPDSS